MIRFLSQGVVNFIYFCYALLVATKPQTHPMLIHLPIASFRKLERVAKRERRKPGPMATEILRKTLERANAASGTAATSNQARKDAGTLRAGQSAIAGNPRDGNFS
jgi:hypothetical protein